MSSTVADDLIPAHPTRFRHDFLQHRALEVLAPGAGRQLTQAISPQPDVRVIKRSIPATSPTSLAAVSSAQPGNATNSGARSRTSTPDPMPERVDPMCQGDDVTQFVQARSTTNRRRQLLQHCHRLYWRLVKSRATGLHLALGVQLVNPPQQAVVRGRALLHCVSCGSTSSFSSRDASSCWVRAGRPHAAQPALISSPCPLAVAEEPQPEFGKESGPKHRLGERD